MSHELGVPECNFPKYRLLTLQVAFTESRSRKVQFLAGNNYMRARVSCVAIDACAMHEAQQIQLYEECFALKLSCAHARIYVSARRVPAGSNSPLLLICRQQLAPFAGRVYTSRH